MWMIDAVISSFFAGITAILAKCGIKKTDSDIATALRTTIVLIFSWILVAMTGVIDEIKQIDMHTLFFLVLSGLATGASWLCYFRALQLGDVNKVVPIDKSSTVLTILFAFIFFNEILTWKKGIAIIAIGVGTILMIQKSKSKQQITQQTNSWLIYAVLSALFASATAILGKIGVANIDSNLATAIRTTVVFVMAWMMVYITGKKDKIQSVEKKEFIYIILSGLATGMSWLCYYRALQNGITSVVVSIDKLSILMTFVFSWIVLKESFSKKMFVGMICIILGTLLLAL